LPTVEEVYHQAWGKVGGVGRLRRTFSLLKRDEDLDRNCLRERAATLGLNVLLAEFESEV
jgi:hypothetical protein